MLDANSIFSEYDCKDLKDNYVIFITEKDYCGLKKPVYEMTKKPGNEDIQDGGNILYVNGEYQKNDATGHLIHDLCCTIS